MLKVNDSLLLEDYEKLIGKKAEAKAHIEEAAKAFAEARGYNEEQVADFIAYVLNVEGGGLSKDEEKELALMGKYVCEVADIAPVTCDVAEAVADEVVGEGCYVENSEAVI